MAVVQVNEKPSSRQCAGPPETQNAVYQPGTVQTGAVAEGSSATNAKKSKIAEADIPSSAEKLAVTYYAKEQAL